MKQEQERERNDYVLVWGSELELTESRRNLEAKESTERSRDYVKSWVQKVRAPFACLIDYWSLISTHQNLGVTLTESTAKRRNLM
mmetsp:Transcript_8375/g.13220  ORF Transcript_8375/g.13220 Transcript_8375/m.13220 type:complete len:85 (+) Transcript_8375:962-1216(+)